MVLPFATSYVVDFIRNVYSTCLHFISINNSTFCGMFSLKIVGRESGVLPSPETMRITSF